jgi:hypothetical protein
MIFPLNDLFESEEFDNLPPDYYIPRKKIQPCFLGLFPVLFIANGQVFINFGLIFGWV